jgi:hypothetical protein
MAYAVLADEKFYYITIGGHWYSENLAWDMYMPEIDYPVTVTGQVAQNKDVLGKPFYTIEAISLRPAK